MSDYPEQMAAVPPKVDEPHTVDRKDDDSSKPNDYSRKSVSQTSVHSNQTSSTPEQSGEYLSDNDNDYDPESSVPYSITRTPNSTPPLELDKLLSAIGSLPEKTTPTRTDSELDKPLTPEEEEKYQSFLATEQEYIHLDQWDRFPYGSRMFLGNLPTERISKRQLFKIFYKYGGLAQISIKKSYGFVQYFDPAHCARAMDAESRIPLKGNYLHLEISKPQAPRHRRRGQSPQKRNRDSRNRLRGHHDHQHRHHPYHQFVEGGVPEVQIFALDRLKRDFLRYIEECFERVGATTRVEQVPSASLNRAIEQMAFKGALGVAVLDRQSQETGRLDIRVFDRTGPRVRYDEYAKVDVNTAVELANRMKRNSYHTHQASQHDQSMQQVQSIMDQLASLQQSS
ncbi:hypothetical protein TRVA0_002S05226 [Trichomonascus vanleenenianus]|uniref:uncharacterized protein n=1 Tax=Trichomonascus vanleenenianus TaxID=2268995 RepID=UPI003EC95CB8